jgi:hypothetical protein
MHDVFNRLGEIGILPSLFKAYAPRDGSFKLRIPGLTLPVLSVPACTIPVRSRLVAS